MKRLFFEYNLGELIEICQLKNSQYEENQTRVFCAASNETQQICNSTKLSTSCIFLVNNSKRLT